MAMIMKSIVTDWAVAKRRIGKHVPTKQHPTIGGRPLLGNTCKHITATIAQQ
jgi:hypothetical protein